MEPRKPLANKDDGKDFVKDGEKEKNSVVTFFCCPPVESPSGQRRYIPDDTDYTGTPTKKVEENSTEVKLDF